MADVDYGLIGGLAEGLKAGMGAYNDQMERRRRIAEYEADQKMKKTMAQLSFAKEGYLPPDETGLLKVDTDPNSPFNREKELAEAKNQAFLQATMDKKAYQDYQNRLAEAKLEIEKRKTDGLLKKTEAETDLIKKKTKSSGGPAQVKLTSEARKAIGGFQTSLATLDQLEQAYKGGAKKSYISSDAPIIGKFMSDTPVDSYIRKISDDIGRMRSGGAINRDEETRFKNMLPRPGDSNQMAMKKLNDIRNEFNTRINAYTSANPLQDRAIIPNVGGGPSRDEKLKRLKQLEGK